MLRKQSSFFQKSILYGRLASMICPHFGNQKNLPINGRKAEKKGNKTPKDMKTIDESIQKQLNKPQTWFVKYFPKRIKNLSDESIKERQLVYDFKDGKINGIEIVARVTASKMLELYGDECSNIVLSCVPASSEEKYQIRYKLFSELVCRMTGAINGFQYVNIIGERLAIHEHRSKEKEIRKVSIIEFDEKWFNGKKVLCFDDIITRGHSYANYANQLESIGANVIGGMFLARTHYRTNV